MRFITMHPNVQTKSSDTSTTDLYPIYSPTSPSSSPVEKSSYQRHALSRRRKVVSESLSNDLFLKRSLRHLSPDSVMHARMFTMPEEGTSSADEEHDLPSSTRSMGPGYLLLSAKDRLKSASLEWTLSNGSVTPRAMHYHTHPPLDFKSLKEKLEQLTGSPDDANKKHFVSGLDRRKGVSTTLPASSRAVTNPAGGQSSAVDAGRQTDHVLNTTAAGRKDFFQNVPYVTVEPMSRTLSEEVDSKPITMKTQVSMKSLNQSGSRDDSDISDGLHWSDLARYVAQKDGRLQMILKRHCQELKDLKQRHEGQWVELRHRMTFESVAEDSYQRNETQLQSEQSSRNKDCFRPLVSSGFDDLKPESPGVDLFGRKQPTGHSLAIKAVAAQPDFDLSRSDSVVGGNSRTDNAQCVDGVYGFPQQLSTLVQHQMAAATLNAKRQQQLDSQTSYQTEKHIWSDLVNRTPGQWKIPPVPQQVEPLNWYQQQLDMLHGMQAAGSLEQRMLLRQLILQQVPLLEAQNQPVNIRCHRFPNHQCYCARPCDLLTPLYNQEYSHSVGPYSALNWNDGSPGVSYTPNYAQGIPYPQPSSIYHHSPCNEVSSYYYPENLALSSKRQQTLCCSPDQMACLLDNAAKNHLLPASPVLITTPPPTPMPLFFHLLTPRQPLSRQTSMEGSYPPSLRPSSSLGLPLFSPLNVFQFPYDIRQLFYPMNPFAA